ncbi:DUF2804 domain-containing protein [Arvimicrobium flavum]|uniref:DUF2804 domain-containing protein n=1 Tax=Arvimicrobium flavum TaxID=3393320 RepID=UPI00237C1654|nr:DUF2804 domain-containing protein [Mesorhizobium shangrilense]
MVGGIRKTEREITAPVDLCRPDGTLNPAAVGWSRTPLHTANLKGWGRNKRFEYWCVTSPDFVVAINISHGDYRVTLAAFFLDLKTMETFSEAEIHWLPRGKVTPMPERSGSGPLTGTGDKMRISMEPNAEGTLLRAKTARMEVAIQAFEEPGHECMCVVVPWDNKRFQYTRKDNCMPATGTVRADGRTYELSNAYATLDHGRGRWPYSIVWNWASGSGVSRGREIGLQFGAKWTDGTPSTENSLRIDKRVEKISQELEWTYDRADWMKPWTIRGDRVDLKFTPVYDRYSNFDRLIVCSKEHQVFGWFDGSVVSESGERIPVERIFGWAEEVHRKW